MTIQRLSDIDVRGKRVFIRADLNVPQDDAGNDHRRHADPRVGAGDPRRARARRRGDGDVAPRPPDRRASGRPRIRSRRSPRACPSCSASTCRWFATGSTAARGMPRSHPGQVVLLENCRMNKGEKKDRRRARAEDGEAVRRLRQRRVRHRASRRGDDARHRQVRAGRLRRSAARRGARRAGQGARASAAPAGRHRRRLEGVDQAHDPARARREGRRADRRRRHRQHVHPRGRRQDRQVAGRAGSRRRSEGDPRRVSRQGADAGRRRRCARSSRPPPQPSSRRSRTSRPTT